MSPVKKLLYIAVFSLITFAGASLLDAATPQVAVAAKRTTCPHTACNTMTNSCYYSGGSSVCIQEDFGCSTLGCS